MLSLSTPWNRIGGAEVQLHSISVLHSSELLTSRPGSFNPTKEARYLLNRRQNRPQPLLVGFPKRKTTFPQPRFEPLTVQTLPQALFGLLYPRPSFILCELIYWTLHNLPGDRGSTVVKGCATNRTVGGSIPAGVSGFFIDIKSFRSHCGLGIDSASKRNEYQEYLLGGKSGRCVRLTTYHHPVPLLRNLGTLWALPGLIYLSHNLPFQSPQKVTYSLNDRSAEMFWCLNTNRSIIRGLGVTPLACNTEG